MSKPRVYLAAPLFNERERTFNSALAAEMQPLCEVFLPQRDGLLLADLLRQGVPVEVAETRIFERDRSALLACDLLVAVLDGAHVDEGVAFEIGFAHAVGADCVGLQTDVRRALPSGNNPMITQSMTAIFGDVRDLVGYVREAACGPRATMRSKCASTPR